MPQQPDTQHFPIESVKARAYTIQTDAPEADGTLAWDATTIVIATVKSGDHEGIGYSYTDATAAQLINSSLARLIHGMDAMDVPKVWQRLVGHTRNLGRLGIASSAIAAIDTAVWDLKARRLELPLAQLFGQVHEQVPVYGSGGFTSYSPEQLQHQFSAWAESGIRWVKMKVGTDPEADPDRVRLARGCIGPRVGLFVDANGAYDCKQALALAHVFAEQDVSWFEEPVSSDDLDGLRLLRQNAPPGMEITAGEYGYRLDYFQQMLRAGAVDVLQADVTRCGGFTEFLRVGALAQAWHTPLSAHTSPSLHLHVCCALPALRHIEYFHDHVRIEQMFFDGAAHARDGMLRPNLERPGLGLELKSDIARQFIV
jgi:L-alanine-DL-glutamate epimerase-like enolase superfamily enzyme